MPLCHICGAELTDANWLPSRKKQRKLICRDCSRRKNQVRLKRYRENHRNYVNAWARKSRRLQKYNIILYYSPSGRCQCKGENCWHEGECLVSDVEVLSIDHINGGGNKHRKEVGFGTTFYQWLKRNNYPKGFQVLCMNCQRKRQHKDHQWGNRWQHDE